MRVGSPNGVKIHFPECVFICIKQLFVAVRDGRHGAQIALGANVDIDLPG
jgi:hypothetical protein